MKNREIAERIALLIQDIDTWNIPSLGEVFDFLHETESDLERGGSETLQKLAEICEDFEGYDEVVATAKELINLIHN